jgi:hypothetical protein
MGWPERVREILKVRCVWLRTKASYRALPQAGDLENPYPTATWWCLRTGEALGADGATACPGACDRPGRPCYEGPPRL